MDYATFEARTLELLFKTSQRLTPPIVAFYVECPVDVAEQHLGAMVMRVLLTLQRDARGFLYYDMPGRPLATNEPLSWKAGAGPPRMPPRAIVSTGGIGYMGAPMGDSDTSAPAGGIGSMNAPSGGINRTTAAPLNSSTTSLLFTPRVPSYAPNPVPAYVPPTVHVVQTGEKSPGLAFVLGLLLGPLGMLYATGAGALIMFIVNLVLLPVTAGLGLLLTAPVGAIWAASAASDHNMKARAAAERHQSSVQSMSSTNLPTGFVSGWVSGWNSGKKKLPK